MTHPTPRSHELLGDFLARIPSHYTRRQTGTTRHGQPIWTFTDPYGPEGDFVLTPEGDTFTVTGGLSHV
jgi:hypothetical protein